MELAILNCLWNDLLVRMATIDNLALWDRFLWKVFRIRVRECSFTDGRRGSAKESKSVQAITPVNNFGNFRVLRRHNRWVQGHQKGFKSGVRPRGHQSMHPGWNISQSVDNKTQLQEVRVRVILKVICLFFDLGIETTADIRRMVHEDKQVHVAQW